MRNLLLIAVFVVTWNCKDGNHLDINWFHAYQGRTFKVPSKEFWYSQYRFKKSEDAERFCFFLKSDPKFYDVKIWKMEKL